MTNRFMKPLHDNFNARLLRLEIEGVDSDFDNTDEFMVTDTMTEEVMASFTSPFGFKKKVKVDE
mgnify:CR=1 FL=1